METLWDCGNIKFSDCYAWPKRSLGKKVHCCYQEICANSDDKMAISTEGLWSIFFYEYLNGIKITEALEKLFKVFGDDIIGQPTCYEWHKKFASGVWDMSDVDRSGRPHTVDDDALEHVLKNKLDANVQEPGTVPPIQPSTLTFGGWDMPGNCQNGYPIACQTAIRCNVTLLLLLWVKETQEGFLHW